MSKQYQTFKAFYPFYLSQHSDARCRAMHYMGSLVVIVLTILAVLMPAYWLLYWLPVVGYGFAWFGHFAFEHNKPATFEYPWYSFIADWVMLAQWLSGRHR